MHACMHACMHPTYLHTYLRTYVCTYINTCVHTCFRPSIHPSIRPSVHPSIRPSVHPSIHPSIHPGKHTCLCTEYVDTDETTAGVGRDPDTLEPAGLSSLWFCQGICFPKTSILKYPHGNSIKAQDDLSLDDGQFLAGIRQWLNPRASSLPPWKPAALKGWQGNAVRPLLRNGD